MANKRTKRIAWTTAFIILAVAAALYSASLLVALASDGTTWDRYIPVFRDGQKIGFLVFSIGVVSIVIVALSMRIEWLMNQLNHGASTGDTGAVSSSGRLSADTWRSYKQNRIALLVLVLGWIPAGSTFDFAHQHLRLPIPAVEVLMFLWLAAVMVEGARLAIWPCPNCGRSFRGLLPFLPKQCRHCDYRRN